MTMDFIRDQNPTALYEVGIRAGDSLPNYVKEASILQEEELTHLADTAFADSIHRLHPIHTKAATFMSAVYLAGAGAQGTSEFNTVKEAADFHGISADVEAAIQLLAVNEKSASEERLPVPHAITFELHENETWTAYPMANDVQVVKAATDVVRDWNDGHIPTDWLFAAAKNIVKRATALDMYRNSIPDRIWALGEERLVDFSAAETAAETRKHAGVTDITEYEQAVKKAADGTISVAEAIDTWMYLDTTNNVNHKRYISPHEAFYSGPKVSTVEKLAAENVIIENIMVPINAFTKLADNNGNMVRASFRKEAAENILSIADMLKTASAKTASTASAKLSKLTLDQRKEVLNLLTQVA